MSLNHRFVLYYFTVLVTNCRLCFQYLLVDQQVLETQRAVGHQLQRELEFALVADQR